MNPESSQMLRQRRKTLAQPLQADETEDSLEIVVFSLSGDLSLQKSLEADSETKPLPLQANDGGLPPTSGLYAFETLQVREVFPVADASHIAILPGTPPWVRGILNVRGRILAVLDLQQLFGLPQQETLAEAPVLILRGDTISEKEETLQIGDVALATNGVAGVRILPRTQLETGHALDGTAGARYLRGLTQDGIALLDAGLVLSDMQLVVQAE
jgi:purine-binding chemotaxis protein CheW